MDAGGDKRNIIIARIEVVYVTDYRYLIAPSLSVLYYSYRPWKLIPAFHSYSSERR